MEQKPQEAEGEPAAAPAAATQDEQQLQTITFLAPGVFVKQSERVMELHMRIARSPKSPKKKNQKANKPTPLALKPKPKKKKK